MRLVALALLAAFSFYCLCLYVDSIRQRQKAESLFADLKSFPFASANFSQVREFVLRHDGAAMQEFPPSHFPGLSFPSPDSQGKMNFRLIPTAPTCTPRDCSFEIWIRPGLLRHTLSYRYEMPLLYTLAYIGIRPWGCRCKF